MRRGGGREGQGEGAGEGQDEAGQGWGKWLNGEILTGALGPGVAGE